MRLRLLIVCCLLTVCAACTNTRLNQIPQVSQTAALKHQEKVLIVLPADGRHGDKVYVDSGRYIADKLKEHLALYSRQVNITSSTLSPEQALAEAKNASYRYLFIPRIQNWEPRASSWSGRPGRATVLMNINDLAAEPPLVNTTLLEAQGKSYHTETPEYLMDRLIQEFLAAAYRPTSQK